MFNKTPPAGVPPVWMHLYPKLHMELTLLAFLQIRQWEVAQDLATDCLVAEWVDASDCKTVVRFSKKALLKRLQKRCVAFLRNERNRTIAEEQFLFSHHVSVAQKIFAEDRTEQILRYASHLDSVGATIVRLLLEEEMDVVSISSYMNKPLATIQLYYDRTIYYLKKRFAPASLAVYPLA